MWQIWCRKRVNCYHFLQMSFPHWLWGFLQEIRKFLKLDKLQKVMKKEYFMKKNAFILLRSIFNKYVGEKIASGYWPTCFCKFQQELYFILKQKHFLDYTRACSNSMLFCVLKSIYFLRLEDYLIFASWRLFNFCVFKISGEWIFHVPQFNIPGVKTFLISYFSSICKESFTAFVISNQFFLWNFLLTIWETTAILSVFLGWKFEF